jgi:predicted lipoprotein with Yx(FWY)xxD motif
MRKTSIVPAVLAAGALVLSGCGSNSTSDSGAAAGSASVAASPTAGPSSPGSANALLATARSALGTIVVDGSGRTVYMFTKDTPGSGASSCSGKCLVAWPPVVADSAHPQVDGVTGNVATITRDDGTVQATLDGWPLYYWQGDAAPGDTTGQGVQGVWWVLTPDGAPVSTAPAQGY